MLFVITFWIHSQHISQIECCRWESPHYVQICYLEQISRQLYKYRWNSYLSLNNAVVEKIYVMARFVTALCIETKPSSRFEEWWWWESSLSSQACCLWQISQQLSGYKRNLHRSFKNAADKKVHFLTRFVLYDSCLNCYFIATDI